MEGLRAALFLLTFSLSCFQRVVVMADDLFQCRPNQNGDKVAYTLTVSQSGSGNFTKIQQAIDAIPDRNDLWVRISVDPGTYWEQVNIGEEKQCIMIEGHSREDTMIAYDAHDSTDTSSTFVIHASNFVAKSISFKNSYSFEKEKYADTDDYHDNRKVKQALAASVYGDKSAFYDCGFIGYQDTLWDVEGRHYFKNCFIEGAIDFIWGDGHSVYEDCSIHVIGDGYITAQGRQSLNDSGGFVFIRGSVFGNGSTYLGRAYGSYSTVIFQYTLLSNVVNPLGWSPWWLGGKEGTITYAEVGCTGEGANTSNRVGWERKISEADAEKYYSVELFIDQDNWISQQPWSGVHSTSH